MSKSKLPTTKPALVMGFGYRDCESIIQTTQEQLFNFVSHCYCIMWERLSQSLLPRPILWVIFLLYSKLPRYNSVESRKSLPKTSIPRYFIEATCCCVATSWSMLLLTLAKKEQCKVELSKSCDIMPKVFKKGMGFYEYWKKNITF